MHAKILQHSSGLGLVDPETVRRRAMEIATINGRSAGEYTEGDWSVAKCELQGGNHALAASEDTSIFPGHGLVAGTRGRRQPRYGDGGEETVGEELVAEGLDEAAHDQMLEAHRLAEDADLNESW